MTADLEYEGKNVQQALERAAASLGVDVDQIEYEVVSKGSSGFFGLGPSRNAKIRVKAPAPSLDAASLVDRLDRELSGGEATSALPAAHRPARADAVAAGNDAPADDPCALGRRVLERIVESISPEAQVEMRQDDHRLSFSVTGRDAAILIGKRGQTLEAIQLLVEKIVNKHHTANGKIRVEVDIEGYLQTRQENLQKLAYRLAKKAKRIGKPITLSQMSPYERRIIHLALKEDPDVRTKSKGEGQLRKLVIFPRKAAGQP